MIGQRFTVIRSGVGDNVVDALASVLAGKTAVKTESAVTASVTPIASGTVITVATLAVVAVYLITNRPRRGSRRRSKRSAT